MPAPTSSDPIDLIDTNGRVIGSVPRGDVLSSGGGFKVVHVLVFDKDDRILLQKVASAGTRSPGKWGSSVAGYLHAGESPLAGARRRMHEEVGLTSSLDFAGRARMRDEQSTKFIYVYTTHADHAAIVDRTHIDDLRFWSMDEIEAALKGKSNVFTATFPYVLRVVRKTHST